jgi:hypothetical protein
VRFHCATSAGNFKRKVAEESMAARLHWVQADNVAVSKLFSKYETELTAADNQVWSHQSVVERNLGGS